METLTATIKKIAFSNDTTGFKVLVTQTQAGKTLIIIGEFGPELVPETIAIFNGDYKTHPKYGYQFKSLSYKVEHNAQELASIKIFLDCVAENVGPERSQAIISYFGTETLFVIENNPERLTEVSGIGKVIAQNISDAWKENKEKWSAERILYSIRAFLMSLGLRERRIKKILEHFGGREFEVENIIRNDPYVLLELEDFGFTTVDFIAKNLGIAEDNPQRFNALIIHLMDKICPSNGHLYLTIQEMLDYVKKYCIDQNTTFLGKNITEFELQETIKYLVEENKLILDDDTYIYSKKQFNFESNSAKLLVDLMEEKSDLIFLTREVVTEYIETFNHEHGIELSAEQKEALYLFAEKKVLVITGGPGTGKTLSLKAIVELATTKGFHLTCMTPTGISAKKLSVVINQNAYTVHRRLQFQGNKWGFNEISPYHTDIVIIDEVSMLDQEVFYRLLSALKKRTHVVLVGDHNQLPSVSAGNVLRELINCGQIPVVKFEKIFRQENTSDIITAAHRIIHGDTNLDLFKNDPKADIYFLRMHDTTEIERIIVALADKFKSERREFQIISARNEGPLGVGPLNNILQAALNAPAPHLNEIKMFNFVVRVGDRVLVTKNDYEKDVFNGDIGKVVNISGGKITVNIDDRPIDFDLDEISDKLKLGYALTIHKMQGLESATIILPFVNQFGKNMLQRNLLYTALTRAKKKVIMLGHGSAVEKAINNICVVKRNTRLGERIKKCLAQRKKPSSLEQLPELLCSQVVSLNKEPSLSKTEKYYPTDLIEKLMQMEDGL